MKLKVVELVLNNYENKLKDFDVNYFIVNNLENQINMSLFKLESNNINDSYSLPQKIENITNYLNKNINSQFNSINKKESEEHNSISENNLDNEETEVFYKYTKEFNYNFIGFLDFNKDLFAFYSSDSIYFISKNNYKTKFQAKEYVLERLKICKKIDDENILAYNGKNILTIKILDNNDYMISKKIDFSIEIFEFNSNFDLLYLDYPNTYFSRGLNDITIRLISYPDYNKIKFSISNINNNFYNVRRFQFKDNDIFFSFSFDSLESYVIKDNKCYLKNRVQIKIEPNNATIIDLSDELYCLNDLKKILLLNKKDLVLTKTINIESNNLGLLKISNKLISIFICDNILLCKNYVISNNGIKWSFNKKQNLLYSKIINFYCSGNYIIFKEQISNGFFSNEYKCFLFEIKTGKLENLDYLNNNLYQCSFI